MSTIGIIAEFNPLHNGHKYLIDTAEKDDTVVCVISGNFVQRGDVAVAEKRIRAKAALMCGADLVAELPVPWSMSTAQNFALGGVSALDALGCDKIIFGSEAGENEKLIKTAEILNTEAFSEKLKAKLKSGVTFAAARQAAAEEIGAEAGILEGANNNLAIEYITACKNLGLSMEFKTVKRIGAMHDCIDEDIFVSASLLRKKLQSKDYEFCKRHMPNGVLELFAESHISDINRLEKAILAVLRSKSREELSTLPDLSEGVENKLFNAIRVANSLEELYNEIKVKRYTLARVRRLVLNAFIGVDNSFFMKPLPYVRVLGFNKKGEELLKSRFSTATVPIITKCSQIEELSSEAKKVFETEAKATDLFALSTGKPMPCGIEYTSKLIREFQK